MEEQEKFDRNQTTDQNLATARKLIEQLKEQLGYESEKIMEYKMEMYKERDFRVHKFYTYTGPNYYLDTKAVVFNLFIAPNGDSVDFVKDKIVELIPALEKVDTPYMVDLFTAVVMNVLRMDIDLYINKHSVTTDGDEYVIAVEYLDKRITEKAVKIVSNWFRAITTDKKYDFIKEYTALQHEFDKTLFGGPTLYSLVEAGLKRNIPVMFLPEENQFMWGYGKKQLRGRSTTFHNDGIKDTEFTMYKDMVGEFLLKCGFPTPQGKNCFDEEEIVAEAYKIGFPLVVKPVAGHKGRGVVTGIETEEEVRKVFKQLVAAAAEEGINFDGALIQNQIYGTDHRLLAINGKFAAALERVPAFVVGDGVSKIKELIAEENKKEIRLDNARSPLCKINIDNDLIDYLSIQGLTIEQVPQKDEKIILRRVANISAGGVSINVTDAIHPLNIKLVEDIASYLNVRCLGIDVLAADISKPWREGNFGIIEINAGPGVFMHLAPAYGGSIDVPGKIIESHFENIEKCRMPIIAANFVSQNFADKLYGKLKTINSNIFYSSLTSEGVFFNGEYFYNNPNHDENIENMLRHPKLDFALISHESEDILDFGIVHEGCDLLILDETNKVEFYSLTPQLFKDGYIVEVEEDKIYLKKNDEVVNSTSFDINNIEEKDDKILQLIDPLLVDLLNKYE